MAKHNKKRNVGLLHEQLVRHASQMTVEGKRKEAEKAIKILVESFNEGSELLREFKLFSALAHSKVSDREIAKRIVQESKKACSDHDPHALDKEKSRLIRENNHTLNRHDFYNQRVDNYRIFSTIQALLNEWRGKNSLTPDERVRYEIVLEDHLSKLQESSDLEKKENADPLILNLMIEKFNKKYGKELSNQQIKILENTLVGDEQEVLRLSNLVKNEAKYTINRFYESCNNDVLNEKYASLLEKVDSYIPENSDESVSKALMLSDLISEMEGKEDVK